MRTGNVKEVLKSLYREFETECLLFIEEKFPKILKKETESLIKTEAFRIESAKDAANFSFENLCKCARNVAPFVYTVILSISINPRNKRCKLKSNDSITPALMTALSILLYTRNRLMNVIPFIQTCILRRGQAKKEVFGRFVYIIINVIKRSTTPHITDLFSQKFKGNLFEFNCYIIIILYYFVLKQSLLKY